MITAVILARKGSKRLPGKNKRTLMGRPLVAWAIVEAQKSAYIDEILLSSDDEDVLQIGHDYGVELVQRPPRLATDEATSYDAIMHATSHCDDDDLVVLLQPTSPLRVAADIDHCVKTCIEMRLDAAATATQGEAVPNGAVYVANSLWVNDGGNWDDEGVKLVPMPYSRSIDIDTLEDFQEAERLMG